MGTLAAIPFAYPAESLPSPVSGCFLAGAFLLGVMSVIVSSKRLGQHDPGGIVWDEMVAYWLTVAFIPLTWQWWLLAFVLFRFFDIVKPWPIRRVEKRLAAVWASCWMILLRRLCHAWLCSLIAAVALIQLASKAF